MRHNEENIIHSRPENRPAKAGRMNNGRSVFCSNKPLRLWRGGASFIFLSGVLISSLLGCQHLKHPIAAVKKAATELFPPYSGLKASITVADFDANAAKATNEINTGLREMLISALASTHRFLIVERQTTAKQLNTEENAQKDRIPAADLVIAVTVFQFEPQTSGGTEGIGGGGSVNSGLLGGLLGSLVNKAHLTLDVRLVSSSTSEVLDSSKIRGQARDANIDRRTSSKHCKLAAGLSDFSDAAMGKAICMSIDETVRYIAEAIPANYFKYK